MQAAEQPFDVDLIRRYDVSGPRYTSYPSANLFSDSLEHNAYGDRLRRLDDNARLSIYVHVPFCATVCYYCACNKIITNNRRHAVAYLDRLFREMAMVSEDLGSQAVEQLHFGGGTPTYLNNDQFEATFAQLREHFRLVEDERADFSIEIDPRTVDEHRIRFLTGLGINRISLGIQDFDPAVQAAVNRLQSEAETAAIIDAARRAGVASVSVDLIYGLPLQHRQGFSRTLARVLELRPDRISLYNYAHLPQRFKTQRQINAEDIPSPEVKLELLRTAVETLTAAGYCYVGMDHFALPGDELVRAQREGGLHRNFQGYTTHGHCELIGLGVSAISSIDGLYCQNVKTLDAYYEAIDSGRLATEKGLALTGEDSMIRELIGTLMCSFQLDIPTFESAWGIRFRDEFADALGRLEPMARDGLLEISDSSLKVTERGRFLIRNVAMAFDRHLDPATAGFSRTI